MLKIINGARGSGRTLKLVVTFLHHANKHKLIIIGHPSQRERILDMIFEYHREEKAPFPASTRREYAAKIVTVWELQNVKQGLPVQTDLFLDNAERVLGELLRFNVAAAVFEAE